MPQTRDADDEEVFVDHLQNSIKSLAEALVQSPRPPGYLLSAGCRDFAPVAADVAESNRRLLELNRAIVAGELAYTPFGALPPT